MTRRALIVGVNEYPAPYALGGCVADAVAWSELLARRGFRCALLLDGAATQRAILDHLLDMVTRAQRGDVLTFVYSGHEPGVCHSFVKDGAIQYLGDCTHALAGQTVPLPRFGNPYRGWPSEVEG